MGKQPIKKFTYTVEERHRGKWQPIIADNGKEKTVFITEDSANELNAYSDETEERYVKGDKKESKKDDSSKNEGSKDSKNDLDAIKAEYEEVVGKKPFHGWDAATLKDKIKEAKS